MDEENELKSIFEVNKNPRRIIELLSLIGGEKILPGEALVIFDEIQECPAALNALKYFREKQMSIISFRPAVSWGHYWPNQSPALWVW